MLYLPKPSGHAETADPQMSQPYKTHISKKYKIMLSTSIINSLTHSGNREHNGSNNTTLHSCQTNHSRPNIAISYTAVYQKRPHRGGAPRLRTWSAARGRAGPGRRAIPPHPRRQQAPINYVETGASRTGSFAGRTHAPVSGPRRGLLSGRTFRIARKHFYLS